MNSSCDYPLGLNPAYREDPKPDCGYDDVDVPVFDGPGEIIEHERIHYTWEQYGREMKVSVDAFYKAFPDDVYDAVIDNHRGYEIEFIN
jgi:hypothetical protein